MKIPCISIIQNRPLGKFLAQKEALNVVAVFLGGNHVNFSFHSLIFKKESKWTFGNVLRACGTRFNSSIAVSPQVTGTKGQGSRGQWDTGNLGGDQAWDIEQ